MPETFIEKSDEDDEPAGEIMFYPPASFDDNEYSIIKFYTFSSSLAANALKNMPESVNFPFRVTDLEYEILQLPFFEPIILIGRSGTGKTTCCLYRMWHAFQNYWLNVTQIEADEQKLSDSGKCTNVENINRPSVESTNLPSAPSVQSATSSIYVIENNNPTLQLKMGFESSTSCMPATEKAEYVSSVDLAEKCEPVILETGLYFQEAEKSTKPITCNILEGDVSLSNSCGTLDIRAVASGYVSSVENNIPNDCSAILTADHVNSSNISWNNAGSQEPFQHDTTKAKDLHSNFRQIFITKNRVLCKEVEKNFRQFMHADDHMKEHIKYEDRKLPNRLQDINDYQFPLFLTDHEFLLMLDASLEPPYFFKRHIDGSLHGEIKGWTDLDDLDNILSLYDFDDYSDSESESSDDDENNVKTNNLESQINSSKSKYVQPKQEVTYEVFKELIWPRLLKTIDKCKNQKSNIYHPSLVWTELMSFIKGSYEALCSTKGYLDKTEYICIGRKRAPVFNDERDHIYELFVQYQLAKQNNRMFDQTDLVRNLYQRLMSHNHEFGIEQIYVDEAQDFTQAELYLLIKLCDCPSGMFLTGDTAQSIMKGISFRFSDIKTLFVDIRNKTKYNPPGMSLVPDKIYCLPHNYRSHTGIISLAISVLDLMYELFPESFDKLEKDKSLFAGPKPVLLESYNSKELSSILCQHKRETSGIDFGAHQAILVVDDDPRKRIPDELKGALILTLYESKGLEFDDVLLYNIFKDSQASADWRVVTTLLKERLNPSESQIGVLQNNSGFTITSRPLTYDPGKHKVLNSELKQLYTAITRARVNVWIFDEDKERRLPIFEYFKALDLADVVSEKENSRSFATKSTPKEWIATGNEFMKKGKYDSALICFQNAGDTVQEKIAYAYQHFQKARSKPLNSTEMKEELYQAAILFLELRMPKEAAKCLECAKHFELAKQIYEKGKEPKQINDENDLDLQYEPDKRKKEKYQS